MKQLSGILNEIDLDELGIQGQFKEEVERYYKFSKGVLGMQPSQFEKQREADTRNYAKYLLKEGSIVEKRALLSCLQSKLVMRDKRIVKE